jgi:hypothetical protein
MAAHAWTGRHLLASVGGFFGHMVAVVVGFALMVMGLAMGVTMVLLPVGIVVGIVGILIFLGGIFARANDLSP